MVVLRLAGEAIEMDDDVSADLEIEDAAARVQFVHGARASVDFAMHRQAEDAGLQPLIRHAIVDRVDHAADGVRPVEQRRRPAHDFDGFEDERIDGDGMIRADRGNVGRVHAILQHANAIRRQTADDGTTRARRKVSGRNAGLPAERLADARLKCCIQALRA